MAVSLDNSLFSPGLQRYFSVLYVLTLRNLKIRYRGSILGVYWSLLNPMIMTGIYTAIFGQAFTAYYDYSLINYLLAAFTGLVVTNFFVASTSQALTSVVSNGALLNKIQVPMSVFPLSMIAANLFQFSVGSLPLLAVATLLITHNPLHLLLLPLPILELLLTCTGIGLLIGTLYVFFRDLPYFYELITFALWISSPVFYPAAIVPEQVRAFLVLNPLWPIIEGLRQVVLSNQMPDFGMLGLGLLSSMLTCAIGCFCFLRWREAFMDLL
jgi:lipopolysaccharide transport system permease protein